MISEDIIYNLISAVLRKGSSLAGSAPVMEHLSSQKKHLDLY